MPTNKIEYYREWRKKNADYVKQQRIEYYEKNKNHILAKSFKNYHEGYKQKRKANPEYYKELDRQKSAKKYAKRKALLLQLRLEMGGKCTKCGYDDEPRILNFHHLGDKINNVANILVLNKIKEEAKKCILLCPNCHTLEHL